jgi:hypothetical protein
MCVPEHVAAPSKNKQDRVSTRASALGVCVCVIQQGCPGAAVSFPGVLEMTEDVFTPGNSF